ncbi:ABC transporter ATP-binding protein [Marinomonas mediterranea]|jgi:ABC-type cobalamin/Fe3+-siderophores transport systems, ATPase components|uniref:Iron-chelate-transporting ATPase n=1 Tax=Marinomonas mediterranea (strain ATCC 700492 / JCM 21426 / NBRC 103028 / MMB-1) TaxID=717774 RepID=F2JZB6_MARM1|nr:ABC transporter ATP-binding protein [Marinomonas mediterranea]ADZ93201.1 Iron-chelate-transporting ATPase [Marinomonas mediterranea MMB-1]
MVRQERIILALPELNIPTNKLVAIIGHNGSGKSTLMNVLARQSLLDSGDILLDGVSLSQLSNKALARRISFLPQGIPSAAGLTVSELVALGRYPWRGAFGRLDETDHQIIARAIEQVDLQGYEHKITDDLSGGERQRAWIAMLLAQQSPILLLDEPTSALDIAHQYELMNLLHSLNRQHEQGVIVILHDINLAARYADHIIALQQGRCFYQGAPEELMNKEKLVDLYGIPMTVTPHPNHESKVALVC